MAKFPITTKGFERIKTEVDHLKKVERPQIIQAIVVAREHGDLSENAEYHAAREKQSFIEGRIAELEDKIARAEVIDVSHLSGDTIKFGATVTLIDEDTEKETIYTITSEYEANLDQGLISVNSPLARALIGKTVEDYVEVHTPKGIKGYEISKITYIA